MSKINRHPVRRTAAGVLAGALALSGAVAGSAPAFAAPGFTLDRVQGNDRYETSANIAAAFGNATNIILASGESGRTPDALAANFLAGVRNAPVLLTRRDTTPEPILAQLRTLRASGATRITVVGGPVAVADAQLESLRSLGFTVDRVAGANRYETAAAVAVEGETGEPQEASNIGIIASGVSTIDALAGGPLSYKGRHPLFLVTRDDAPGATIAALRATGVTSVFILGGEAVVGPRVVAELTAAGITVRERLAGANRSETSVAIANRLIADFGFSANTFNLASGINEGIDALGGAALSGKENRVLLITNNATSAAPVTAFATTNTARLTQTGRIFGGIAAVAANLETAVETAGGSAGATVSATVRPELQSAAVTGTVLQNTGTAQNPEGTSVRYTFDEAVTVADRLDFKVYNAAGGSTTATSATLEAGGRSVVALFAGINTATLAGGITTAAVDDGAVRDADGNLSVEGDAGVGATVAPGGAGSLPAGITTAPDLLSVGNFRSAAQDTQTAVDFTFDEAAFRTGAALTNFQLALVNGGNPSAVTDLGFTNTGGTSVPGGNGTTVFTLVFDNPDRDLTGGGDTADITAAEVGRGLVLANTVSDASSGGNLNETQAADVSGTTIRPDLVTVQFRPGAAGTTDLDRVLFDFDQAISGTPAAGGFSVYKTDGTTSTGTGTVEVNSADTSQVLVSFTRGDLVNAVGGVVAAGTVTAASGSGASNLDEEGAAGTSSSTSGQTPNRTAGPDLTGVVLSQATNSFGAVTGFQAAYTFDEDIAGTVGGGGAPAATTSFFVHLADGTRLVADTCTVGNTEATDNVVTCTGFDLSTAGGTQATSAQIGSATLGTVDAGAVTGTDAATTVSGASDAVGNPEGAELTTGGTGTRTS